VAAGVAQLLATEDGTAVVAATTDDLVIAVDTTTGAELGRAEVADVAELAEGGSGEALVARPAEVDDPAAAASVLAGITGDDAGELGSLLTSDAEVVVLPGSLDATTKDDIETAITDGRLTGLSIETRARVAAASPVGVTFIATSDGSIVDTVETDGPATGLARVTGIEDPSLYVATGDRVSVIEVGGDDAADPRVVRTLPMPASVRWVAYDPATQLVHVLGDRHDEPGSTVYVIEPHADAVFADAPLDDEPVAWAMDVAKNYPSADRLDLLTFDEDGTTSTIEVGRNQVGWRLPGVLAGVLAAAIVFLLARMLFARRAVAVAAAAFVALDPMLFVQSRIAMNDAYVGLFILAAVTLFAAVWTGAWRWRGAFWVAMPVVGALLGLALASKWVGAYAIGAVAVLVLLRSALGRLTLLAGLVLATTALGYLAVSQPSGETAGANLTFLVIMIALTLAAVVASVLRPVAWSDDEVRFAVGVPAVAGIGLFFVALALGRADEPITIGPISVVPSVAAFGLVALAGLVYLGFVLAGRAGFGPFAPPPAPDDPARFLPPASPPPPFWLRFGSYAGLPVVWLAVCLLAIPLGVYVVSYIPWAMLDGHQLVPGWPPGHDGELLIDLAGRMYDYHDKLRATHAAASPWWAWPLDLKPVWFYQGSFAGNTSAAIYDHGSLVTWWIGIVALGFVGFQSFRRRSLPLALIAILFACLWMPWARIDRATFQYHYYTSLPFVLLAVAYFVAELWHGASRRTWLLARVAAAVAIMGPVFLWLFKSPLCTVAGVEQVYPNSPACVGNPGQIVVTTQVAGLAAVLLVSTALIVWQLVHLDRPDAKGVVDVGRRLRTLVLTGIGAGAALALANAMLGDEVILSVPAFSSEIAALLVAVPLGAVAWVVLTARDPRRFAAGFVLAAAAWTAVLYPNIAAVPLPSTVVNAYQGILPTYLYPFQFAVNTDPVAQAPPLLSAESVILLVALGLTCLIVAYSAWVWRLSLAERDAGPLEPGDGDGLATTV
jgi:4-amino-4-deoxy-L-arabinose transferase-like glycosyltransferase